MDENAIRLVIELIRSTGYVNVSCHKEFDPKIVVVDLPYGLGLSFSYDDYERIREAAGLPEGVCNDDNTSG